MEFELFLPEFPSALTYLWDCYLRLRRRAAVGFSGPQPISWTDIDAFVRHSGLRLSSWEIKIIERLDDIYLSPEPRPAMPEGQTVNAAASSSDAAGVKSIIGAVGNRRVVKRKKKGG